MVAPERDVPGISASAWARPTQTASRMRHVVHVARQPRRPVGDQQDQAEDDQRDADQVEVARPVLDLVAEGDAEDDDRDRRHDHVPAHARVELAAQLGPPQAQEPGAHDADEVAPEVDDDRGHRPELDDGGEEGPGILPAGERGDDAQVRGARDRQELGEPLCDPEDDGLEPRHDRGRLRPCGAGAEPRRRYHESRAGIPVSALRLPGGGQRAERAPSAAEGARAAASASRSSSSRTTTRARRRR